MTIKELENRTGMTRANIRFYEGEGLLAPKRLDNGYRDYSEEDARTLEKIKLLRQIGLDIDTIRKVQNGALTLEQALFSQHNKLEGDKAMLERAVEVCRELELSGVEYDALEPQPYLRKLQPPEQPQLSPPPPHPPAPERDDTPRACYHPWQRWLARMLDMTLYDTVFNVLWLVLLHDQSLIRFQTGSPIAQCVLALALLAFTLAVEPLWLHFWGWTPGKWVFGLKLRGESGEKLTLAQAARRSSLIIWDGYRLNIPLWNLWQFRKCRETGLDGRDCYWDGEEGHRYTKEERRFHPALIYVLVTAAAFAAVYTGLKSTQIPVNCGPLTLEQFAENYNYYFDQLVDQSSTTLPSLDKTGHWAEREVPAGTYVVTFDDTTVWAEPKLTFTAGYVTAVTLHMESEDYMVYTGTRETLALLALSGSAEGTDLFRYNLPGWVETAQETLGRWEDVELDYRGLHISQRVEYSGYIDVTDALVWDEEHGPQHCEKTVTISVIDQNGYVSHPAGTAQASD